MFCSVLRVTGTTKAHLHAAELFPRSADALPACYPIQEGKKQKTTKTTNPINGIHTARTHGTGAALCVTSLFWENETRNRCSVEPTG